MVSKEENNDSDDARVTRIGPIGEDDHTLRVLNFSGGGFDTVMQLGVVHAVLASYGRAPDAVVGVSAGAIQAVALADVLHAGDLSAERSEITRREYEAALDKRVASFRNFVDAAHRAPETVVDGIMPDAYQVDSFEPLAALQLPRLATEEREDRNRWIEKKSGLVHLYNDLLSLDLPFGALVRLARRWLGIKAAGALNSWFKCCGVRLMEVLRIWLLVGSEMRRLTPIVPILARPLLGKTRNIRKVSAGSIIFRFPFIDKLLNAVRWGWYFFLLLNLWVLVSLTVFLSLFALTYAVSGDNDGFRNFLYLFYLFYILPILMPLLPFIRARNRSGLLKATIDISKGLLSFGYYLLKWTVVVTLMATPVTLLLAIYQEELAETGLYPDWIAVFISDVSAGKIAADNQYLNIGLNLFVIAAAVALGWLLLIALRATAMYLWARLRHGVRFRSWYLKRFLRFYNLHRSLADNYGLKRFLVDIFNPEYYGSAGIDEVIAQSISDVDRSVPRSPPSQRRLADFCFRTSENKPRIAVAVAAANVGSGRLTVLDPGTPIIDALLAATAINPVYPPYWIDGQLFIDGTKVGNAPTKALVELLDKQDIAHVKCVHIYAVDPLPISEAQLGRSETVGEDPYENLLDIAIRALHLQRFRDARIEHRLTSIVTDAICQQDPVVRLPDGKSDRPFFRGFVAHIELDKAASLNKRILFARKNERRKAIAETIADGCRASLQVMLTGTIEDMPKKHKTWNDDKTRYYVKCRKAVKAARSRPVDVGFDLAKLELPGSGDDGPGLSEICRHCALRHHETAPGQDPPGQVLEFRPEKRSDGVTDWPLELRSVSEAITVVPRPAPGRKTSAPESTPPVLSCLFSGGVFRGVFQMGVVNAMNLVDLKPNLYAGASVGSITAAMAARALQPKDRDERSRRIAQLAAVYLGMDRIVLTDRFSDFIRNWTIRAANTRFSLRQADEVFRKYDARSNRVFERDLRLVVAGLERLFYINPYQLNRIVHAARSGESGKLGQLLKERIQQWLDRMDVGEEVLGAEAIELLIEQLVLPDEPRCDADSVPLDCLGDDCQLLATTTNLTMGDLVVLGRDLKDKKITMLEGLLASSAFPGVFRPRRSWDLIPGCKDEHQYVDGGLIDNLPVDAVWSVLEEMAANGRIARHPEKGPHLMLAASLEVTQSPEAEVRLDRLESYWPALGARSKELKYNIKLDTFARVARNLQAIRDHQLAEYAHDPDAVPDPLDVEILSVKPRWLCSTFAFHPMLGFRKLEQARSIAHGCAATLIALAGKRDQAQGWSLKSDAIPVHSNFHDALTAQKKRSPRDRKCGQCWLTTEQCPFSRNALGEVLGDAGQPASDKVSWLSKIHSECWKPSTHQQRKADHNR